MLVNMLQLMWINAYTSPKGLQLRYGNRAVASSIAPMSLYNAAIRQQLREWHQDAPAIDAPEASWSEHFRNKIGGKVVALVLAKRGFSVTPEQVLPNDAQSQVLFWQTTKHANNSALVFFEVLKVADISHVAYPAKSGMLTHRPGLVWYPSPFSRESMVKLRTLEGYTVLETLQQWALQLQIDLDIASAPCMNVPEPHSLLLVKSVWRQYSFPYNVSVAKSRASLGLRYIEPLHTGLRKTISCPAAEDEAGVVTTVPQDPAFCLDQAQVFQRLLAYMTEGAGSRDALTQEIREQILCWQRRHSQALKHSFRDSKAHWDLGKLLDSLILSGFFRNRSDLKEAVLSAIPLVVGGDPDTHTYFYNKLAVHGSLPSRSTLYRQQFLLIAAWCKLKQDIAKQLGADAKVVRWATIDSSPQGGHDWVLHGYREVPVEQLASTFEAALEYMNIVDRFHHISSIEDLDDETMNIPDGDRESETGGETIADVRRRLLELKSMLSERLRWHVNLPTAVGSARADVRYKCHAVLHGERLFQPSWERACVALGSVFSITGDLGTESRLNAVSFRLESLVGGWAVRSDRGMEPPRKHQPQDAGDVPPVVVASEVVPET